MSPIEYVLDALGGATVFKGSAIPTVAEMRDRIRRGLPFRSLESVRERLQLTIPEAATMLHMAPRTMARRRETRKLDADQSDRLYRIARLAGHAVAVFGTEEHAVTWLRRPNRALNGEPPLALLDTDIGTRQIEELLGRLEHGIPS